MVEEFNDKKDIHEETTKPIVFEPKEEEKPAKKTSGTNSATVTAIIESFGEGRYICLAGDGTGYWVPADRVSLEGSFSIDLADKEIKLLYNWSKEIDAALPSKEKIVANVRRALWLNGAHDKESLKKSAVQRNLMKGAFPYRIEIEEE